MVATMMTVILIIYIPRETNIFHEDTWVCLDYFVDLDKGEFETRLRSNKLRKVLHLAPVMLRDLITCAVGMKDISSSQEKTLMASLTYLDV